MNTISIGSRLRPFSPSRFDGDRFRRGVAAAVDLIFVWSERARGRRALGELDGRLLDDIGVSRTAAAIESAKPFWRA